MAIKRLEITVPTTAPFDVNAKPELEYWKGKPYKHGAWVEEVVKSLMNEADDEKAIKPDARGKKEQATDFTTEEYHRYPARNGIEYTRIYEAFASIDK